jgi:hypothetical protein
MIIFLLDIFIYQCNMLITNPKQVKRIKMYNDLYWKNTISILESSIVVFLFVRKSDLSAPDSRNQYLFVR